MVICYTFTTSLGLLRKRPNLPTNVPHLDRAFLPVQRLAVLNAIQALTVMIHDTTVREAPGMMLWMARTALTIAWTPTTGMGGVVTIMVEAKDSTATIL